MLTYERAELKWRITLKASKYDGATQIRATLPQHRHKASFRTTAERRGVTFSLSFHEPKTFDV